MPSLITYTLLEDGSIPLDIIDGGYYPNGNVLIGLSSKEETGFLSKEELKDYLDSYTSDWMESNSLPNSEIIAFNSNNATEVLWEKL